MKDMRTIAVLPRRRGHEPVEVFVYGVHWGVFIGRVDDVRVIANSWLIRITDVHGKTTARFIVDGIVRGD